MEGGSGRPGCEDSRWEPCWWWSMVAVGVVIPVIKTIPSLLEYFSVKRAVAYARQQASGKQVAGYFDKQAQIDRITALRGDDRTSRKARAEA